MNNQYESEYERDERLHKERCISMGLVMPMPYAPFRRFEVHGSVGNSLQEKFESFKEKMQKWVEGSAAWNDKKTKEQKIAYIEEAFAAITKSDKGIKKVLIDNIEKVRIVPDFSGIGFGIEVREQEDYWSFRFVEDYAPINGEEFKKMNSIEKCDFLFEHCEFVPFRFIVDSVDMSEDYSHKFKVYQRDKFMMKILEGFLSTCDNKPNPEKYYFLCFNTKTQNFYLKRDKTR